MKNIVTMSVYQCFDYVMDNGDREPYVIISIQDSQNGFGFIFTKSCCCIDVLTLYFDDIERPAPGLKLFTEEQAEEIIEFLKKNEDINKIIIHCYAGESRSVAVAMGIARAYEIHDSAVLSYTRPNIHVYKTMMNQWQVHT